MCCERCAFLATMRRFVFFGSMLHALERQFFTAKPFLFQSLSIMGSSSLRIMLGLNKAVILE